MDIDKKIDKKAVGQRIYWIRMMKGLTLEEFGKLVGGALKSNVSKWEHGKTLPNNERLKVIADLGHITVNKLLTGESTSKEDIEEELNQKLENISRMDKELKQFETILKNLQEESKSNTDHSHSQLSTLVDIQNTSDSIRDLYDTKIQEYKKKIHRYKSSKELLQFEIEQLQVILDDIKNDITLQENPEFTSRGVSQDDIADYLHKIPYILSYETTMKIVEYAELLMEKEENRFNP